MKKIILLLIVLLIVYATFFSEKARLDREVDRLCAIDGGIKVYETVELSAEKFDKYDQMAIPSKQIAKSEDEYYYSGSTLHLIKGNPELLQLRDQVYRASDNKLLGETTIYIRRGGDIPGPWHESSFMCPEKASLIYLKKLIFIKN